MTTSLPQQDKGVMSYPVKPWQRAMFKWPVNLWRLGLGPFVGQVLLLITHTGRKSGLPRRTLVEYHRMGDQLYIPCGFGERAQWYQNIKADPYVTIQASDEAQSVRARRVTDDEELLAIYTVINQKNPVMLGWYLDSLGIQPEPEDILAKKDRLIFLTFEPTDVPTPPPLEADLTWVWGVIGLIVVGLLWAFRPRRRE